MAWNIGPIRFEKVPDGFVIEFGAPSVQHHRYYSCQRKVGYMSAYSATRQAYALSQEREFEYEPYVCQYCGDYRVGRLPV